ncbi:unnamed protein product [Spirodela intermedia]|uniref:Glycosyltransferase family 92 protein n=1 Tax=Spirodela intermedia TaxID=51605 RepID=A0A7I8IE09_SPIIN|nr:unnamed protein product [Spirodela intermedia]CAA6655861.1 unnamed protein product [Spirodela intermedia]
MERKRRLKPLSKAAVTSGVLAVVFISLLGYLAFDPLRDGRGDGSAAAASLASMANTTTTVLSSNGKTASSFGPFLLFPPRRPLPWRETPSSSPTGKLRPPLPGELPPLPSDRPLCVFQNGATSPANFSGVLPYSRHRAAFRCPIPATSNACAACSSLASSSLPPTVAALWWRHRRCPMPGNSSAGISSSTSPSPPARTSSCSPRASTPGTATSIALSRTYAASSSCPPPPCGPPCPNLPRDPRPPGGRPFSGGVPPTAGEEEEEEEEAKEESLLCACTMVFNVAKFLREWVVYHSRIGVDRFFLYDNGSEDDLGEVIAGLQRRGYNVSSLPWPWPKTQEAGFSHCAAAARRRCRWMMYLDVDEFAFSPSWSKVPLPSPAMLKSILPPSNGGSSGRRVGQLSMDCYDFGPSNRTTHPENGVTQGYTCRRRAGERHKSIVRLQAVDPSLRNVIHHFKLRDGYVAGKPPARVVVNHYKYQAWPEFRAKFRRRASAYVADWTDATNPLSKDRTPGLGFAAVEPPDWAGRFCEVPDGRLRELVRRWFGRGEDAGSTGDRQMEWETFR